jgi:DNA-dependent RNA polymerase auxiliary subunit epsilon
MPGPRRACRPRSRPTSSRLPDLALERISERLPACSTRSRTSSSRSPRRSRDREAQNLYLDARAKARGKRKLLETSFRQYFVDLFNDKVAGRRRASPDLSHDQLSLVDDDQLEESIAAEELTRKMKSACEGELYALEPAHGFLLERPDLEVDAIPVSPGSVIAALKDAIAQIEADYKVRRTLMLQLERHAWRTCSASIRDLNTHLVERRILPTFAPRPRAPPRRRRVPSRRALRGRAGRAGEARALRPWRPPTFTARSRTHQATCRRLRPAGPPSRRRRLSPSSPECNRDGGPMITAADEVLVNVVKAIKAGPQSASLGSVTR